MDRRTCFIVLGLFTMLGQCSALRCYKCNPKESDGGAACDDPFNVNIGPVLVDCPGDAVCVKFISRSPDMRKKAVGRDCSNHGAQTCNKVRDSLYHTGNLMAFCQTCDTDICNGGPPKIATPFFSAIVPMMVFSVFSRLT